MRDKKIREIREIRVRFCEKQAQVLTKKFYKYNKSCLYRSYYPCVSVRIRTDKESLCVSSDVPFQLVADPAGRDPLRERSDNQQYSTLRTAGYGGQRQLDSFKVSKFRSFVKRFFI